jgi:hypothetical protein
MVDGCLVEDANSVIKMQYVMNVVCGSVKERSNIQRPSPVVDTLKEPGSSKENILTTS